MPLVADWRPEHYQHVLRLLARQFQLDPRFRRRFDSSDLLQETLLRAHAHRAQFRGGSEGELVKWLQTILINVLRDQVRKANDVKLMQSIEAATDESSARLQSFLEGDLPSPSQQAERHELLLRIAAALEQLPEDQRDVVIQRDLLAAHVAEIAEQMGRTEKSVAGLLLRGRRKLRQLLDDYQ